MNEINRTFWELRFRIQFLETKGSAFQDLFSAIMANAYPGDFVACKPWGRMGDRKNDGYLKSARTLFQVYAPNEMRSSDTVIKIENDFLGALPFWREHFDTWVFVHNSLGGLPPDVIARILDLEKAHSPLKLKQWGYAELVAQFRLLSGETMSSLYGSLPMMELSRSVDFGKLRNIANAVGIAAAQVDQIESGRGSVPAGFEDEMIDRRSSMPEPGDVLISPLRGEVAISSEESSAGILSGVLEQFGFSGAALDQAPKLLANAAQELRLLKRKVGGTGKQKTTKRTPWRSAGKSYDDYLEKLPRDDDTGFFIGWVLKAAQKISSEYATRSCQPTLWPRSMADLFTIVSEQYRIENGKEISAFELTNRPNDTAPLIIGLAFTHKTEGPKIIVHPGARDLNKRLYVLQASMSFLLDGRRPRSARFDRPSGDHARELSERIHYSPMMGELAGEIAAMEILFPFSERVKQVQNSVTRKQLSNEKILEIAVRFGVPEEKVKVYLAAKVMTRMESFGKNK